jgi:hypothetical protein
MAMSQEFRALSVELELAVLRFWAAGVDITQKFGQSEINSVPGLATAIEAVKALPLVIGWGDEEPLRREGET